MTASVTACSQLPTHHQLTTSEVAMQSIRDNDQQSYFYVVWPDERAVQANGTASNAESKPPQDIAIETVAVDHHETTVQQQPAPVVVTNTIPLALGPSAGGDPVSKPQPPPCDPVSGNESSDGGEESASVASDSDDAAGACASPASSLGARRQFLQQRQDGEPNKSAKIGDIGE